MWKVTAPGKAEMGWAWIPGEKGCWTGRRSLCLGLHDNSLQGCVDDSTSSDFSLL